MKRKVLLLEPNYKNKYPPIGLMKLATYHRMLGDEVVFYKGDLNKFVLNELVDELIPKLIEIDEIVNWKKYRGLVFDYIKFGHSEKKNKLCSLSSCLGFIEQWLTYYRNYYNKKKYFDEPRWDRVCVSTLFTFYWKVTVETIEFAKKIVKDTNEVKVGGVLASVMPEDLHSETGIKPWVGLLDHPGILDDNEIIIDSLNLDYSILHEIDYEYPESDGYYGYTTRGCIRSCKFCAVKTIEPDFNPYCSLRDKIQQTANEFGEKRNLLLLDNNVLASENLREIINEIKEAGFINDAKYTEPNLIEIYYGKLQESYNDKAYVRAIHKLILKILKKMSGSPKQEFYDYLEKNNLFNIDLIDREKLLEHKDYITNLSDKYRNKSKKSRYVDYNQGLDARLINDDTASMLSEIPIRPMRVAFDSMMYEKTYINSIKLAAEKGLKSFSNYLLYNYLDNPVELYQRLRINVDLCDELGVTIYSFPMKYHPIKGKDRYNREYLGKHWNRKFVRAVQVVLNATKGKVGKGKSFFDKAFGVDEDEFYKILYMPEVYILHRFYFEELGLTQKWWKEFNELNILENVNVKNIIEESEFNDEKLSHLSKDLRRFMKHYQIQRGDVAFKEKLLSFFPELEEKIETIKS